MFTVDPGSCSSPKQPSSAGSSCSSSSSIASNDSSDQFKEPLRPPTPQATHMYEVTTRNVTHSPAAALPPTVSPPSNQADALVAKQAFISFISNLRQLKAAKSSSVTSARDLMTSQGPRDDSDREPSSGCQEEANAEEKMWNEFQQQVNDMKTSFQVCE